MNEVVNARKVPIGADEVLDLAGTVTDIYVAKGKKVAYVNVPRDKPDAATLQKLLLGPTGNLRAPTLRRGKVLVVGFDAQMYRDVFGVK